MGESAPFDQLGQRDVLELDARASAEVVLDNEFAASLGGLVLGAADADRRRGHRWVELVILAPFDMDRRRGAVGREVVDEVMVNVDRRRRERQIIGSLE